MKVNSANQPTKLAGANAKHQLLENLRQQIQTVTSTGRASDGVTFSSGCEAIDRMLPDGGYSRGAIVQWFNPPSHKRDHLVSGYAAELLSMMAAKHACCDGQAMVVIDPDHAFNPPAASALGVELSSLIVLRPEIPCHNHKSSDLMWAIDQSLRCSAVGAVWGMVGDADPRWLRRFQLSAEQSGVVGCFVRPGRCANQPSWAEVDWKLERMKSEFGGRRSEVGGRRSEGKTDFTLPLGGSGDSPGRVFGNKAQALLDRSKEEAFPARSSRPSQREGEGRMNTINNHPGQNTNLNLSDPPPLAGDSGHLRPPTSDPSSNRLVQLNLLRAPGGRAGRDITIQINTITGSVQEARVDHATSPLRLATELAHPATGSRAATA